MLLLFQKKEERTDLKYSPVKEQEDENVTTLTTLTRWPFILESGTMMWSNMSVFLQALRMLINPPDRPFFINYDSGYINNSQGHYLFILMDTPLQPD